jgi:hypothetical protein
MASLHSFKITGRTAASADGTATGLIATAAVEYHDDGSLRFTTAAGEKVIIQPSANTNKLLKLIFTGTGGFSTGKNLIGA